MHVSISAGESCVVTPDQLKQAHFYVMENTPEIEPYIDRHKLYLKTKYHTKKRAWLEKEHSNSLGDWLKNEVEMELAVDRESISENLRWISHGPDYEIWELDYGERKVHLFKCNWVDTKRGVKRDTLGYKIVELTMLGHKNYPFILASQTRQVFYVKGQKNKKKSIVFVVPPKTYRDAYDDGNDEEFSTVIFSGNENILPAVDPQDLGKESRNDYFRTDC
ncbi:uncharacterized protein LOC113313694 isoform X2 [Papaver somniferum]|uniref:uncharacterized protein LOC113313694 isoform X2 n=1 Tax=Papaver somniferum TaxID=3469 RepID=UPI000E6FB913|nr:uncharacterized protein LOC113313694 isoform X2 [Papaver somniferum]